MKQYKVTVVPGVGAAAATATVVERTFFEAVGDTLKAKIDDETASVGYASTIVDGALIYGAMLGSKYLATGSFSWKPF